MAHSIPCPEEWLLEELPQLYRERQEQVRAWLRTLLEGDADLRWAVIVKAYQDRRLNLGKAAELLGLHELELRERFLSMGIPLRLGPADLVEARAEVDAVRSWYGGPGKAAP